MIKLPLRNLDNKHLKKAREPIDRNILEITKKMKTLNDKNHQTSSQKFRQQTPKEGWRTYRPKQWGNNNKYEDNSPQTLNDKII